MARIIETNTDSRRIIQLSTDDILSIVSEYQRHVPRGTSYENTRNYLEDTAVFVPEDF